mmetsp:Transcript_8033/g.21398  ORF Transcript_8033/g.21398 Transcript_8033/m.21398 type:complete len:202 (+) Transcript_8033:220-825(+)
MLDTVGRQEWTPQQFTTSPRNSFLLPLWYMKSATQGLAANIPNRWPPQCSLPALSFIPLLLPTAADRLVSVVAILLWLAEQIPGHKHRRPGFVLLILSKVAPSSVSLLFKDRDSADIVEKVRYKKRACNRCGLRQCRKAARAGRKHAPPGEDLAKVVWVPADGPQPLINELALVFWLASPHILLPVSSGLQCKATAPQGHT